MSRQCRGKAGLLIPAKTAGEIAGRFDQGLPFYSTVFYLNFGRVLKYSEIRDFDIKFPFKWKASTVLEVNFCCYLSLYSESINFCSSSQVKDGSLNFEFLTHLTLDCSVYVDRFEDIEFLELCSREFIHQIHRRRISRLNEIVHGAQFVGGQVGPKFWDNPRSAGAFCRDFTEKKSPQCRAYTWALQMEKSISPLFPGPEGAVVANDWCII